MSKASTPVTPSVFSSEQVEVLLNPSTPPPSVVSVNGVSYIGYVTETENSINVTMSKTIQGSVSTDTLKQYIQSACLNDLQDLKLSAYSGSSQQSLPEPLKLEWDVALLRLKARQANAGGRLLASLS